MSDNYEKIISNKNYITENFLTSTIKKNYNDYRKSSKYWDGGDTDCPEYYSKIEKDRSAEVRGMKDRSAEVRGTEEWVRDLHNQRNFLDKMAQDLEQRERDLAQREKNLAAQTIDLKHREEELAKAEKEFRARLAANEEDPKEVVDLLG